MNKTKLAFIGTFLVIVGIIWLTTPSSNQEFKSLVAGTTPSYFAEIDSSGVVLRVIVADQAFIDSGAVGNPSNWIQTSMEGTVRKNYAGVGYTYDTNLDAFIPPKPSPDATLDEVKGDWKLPEKPKPPKGAATSTP